jgi:hypothetical protein
VVEVGLVVAVLEVDLVADLVVVDSAVVALVENGNHTPQFKS